jgi:primosomal protein N'
MSLITCKECGTQISDTASSCPKCGAKKPTSLGKTIAIVAGVVFALFIAATFLTPESREQKAFDRSVEGVEKSLDRLDALNRK